VAVALVVVLIALAGLVAWRYLPVIESARSLSARAGAFADEVRGLGVGDIDAATLERLRGELDKIEADLAPVRDTLQGDLLVGALRELPLVGTQVRDADQLVSASDHLVDAGGISLDIGDRFVSVRTAAAAEGGPSLTQGLVRLVAESTDEVDRLGTDIAAAREALAGISSDAIGPIANARQRILDSLERYAPVLDAYRASDEDIPSILGWGGTKRYLVLAQDPAELRPAGGYTGTVGLVTFQDGELTERRFFDVFDLDTRQGLTFVEPPPELAAHLLGDLTWSLADAAWSADFPTAARDAARLYALESGDTRIDGVIALTTYAVDRMLEVTGPIEVPGYHTVVRPGEVTLTALEVTRVSDDPETNRKEFLNALATTLLDRLFSLRAEQWTPMISQLQVIGRERLVMGWFRDPDAQALMDRIGWSGRVRADTGDYVYAVEANVAPSSKYNLVVARASTLDVALGEDGSASSTLRLDWRNDAGKEGEPYEFLRSASINHKGVYGTWVRVLVPAGATLVDAAGQAVTSIGGAEHIGTEAGRAVFGNYLMVRPGTADLTYRWRTPGVVTTEGDQQVYRLLIQKQPGMSSEPVTVHLTLPEGATLVDASEGAELNDQQLDFRFDLTQDQVIEVRYRD
jgi:hypothetical protein